MTIQHILALPRTKEQSLLRLALPLLCAHAVLGNCLMQSAAAADLRGPWRIDGTQEELAIVGGDPDPTTTAVLIEAHTAKRVWSGEYHPGAAGQPGAILRYKPRPEEMNPDIPRAVRQKIAGQLEWTLELHESTDPAQPGLTARWYPGEVRWTGEGDAAEVTLAGRGTAREFRLVAGDSILADIEADEAATRQLTAAERRRMMEQAEREGIAEGGEASDFERAAAAAMLGEETVQLTGPDGQTPEQAAEIQRIQDARVVAQEAARRERLAQADRDSLAALRSNAERDLRRYEEMLDAKLRAEGRSQLTEAEYIERDRREQRFLELSQLTPEEVAEVERNEAVRQQVIEDINRAADNMGGTDAESVAERAQNAAMVDAGTKTWRDFTFTGRMVSEVQQDIFRQREQGIRNNNEVMAAQNYLKRSDLTPEQRAEGEAYLARSMQQRGHNAEAILYDGAIVITGVAADVGTMAVGGTVSRGVSKIFGTEAAAAAGAEAGAQAGRAAVPEVAAPVTRTATGETVASAAAAETSTAVRTAESQATAQAERAATSKPLSELSKAERQAHADAAAEAGLRKEFEGLRSAADDGVEEGVSQVLPSTTGQATEAAAGQISRNLTQSQIDDLFRAGENLTGEQIMQKTDLILSGRVPANYRPPPAGSSTASNATAAAEDLMATQRTANAQAAAAVAEDLTATQRVPAGQSAAALAEDLTATQRVPAGQSAAAAAEDLVTTQRLPPAQGAGNAAGTSFRSAETQVAGTADELAATQRGANAETAAAAAEDLTPTQLLPNTARTAADAAGSTTRATTPEAAAAAVEDLTATQALPNAGRAAATAEDLVTTQRLPPAQGAGNAAGTSFRSAETQIAATAEELAGTQRTTPASAAANTAAPGADAAALQAQNLAREAELAKQIAQRAEQAEQAVQRAAQEGRELTAAEAAKHHTDIVTRQYNQQMNALAQQAREAGVSETRIQQLTQDAFGASPKRGATVAMQNLVEETARARGYTVLASEQAEPIMHTITNVRSGSAGAQEVDVLRRNIQEAARRGADYFDELAKQGTSTAADGFQVIADDVEIEALRQFARAQGLIR